MSDSIIVYAALFFGFILLLIFIRLLPLRKLKNLEALMYYKLELPARKIKLITSAALEEDGKKLNSNGYELIFLSDLEAFMNKKTRLPNNSFLIILNETYSHSLRNALPVLIKENTSMIIFLPILVSLSNKQYQKEPVQQLNEFIFSKEFKNFFSYTQLNSQTLTTIK